MYTYSDTYVTSESGTGIVHQAPGFGEDDLRACIKFGIVLKGESVVCPVDYSGRFTDEVTDFKGQYVKVMWYWCHVMVMWSLMMSCDYRMQTKGLWSYWRRKVVLYITPPSHIATHSAGGLILILPYTHSINSRIINNPFQYFCLFLINRSETPLIYRAVPSWFIRVEIIVDKLLKNNNKCYWSV